MSVRGEIVGIQHLRGLAASAVVVAHVCTMGAMPKYFAWALPPAMALPGPLGVGIFFEISGFIICVVALDRALQPRMSLRSFAVKRFARIIPLMWLAVLSYAGLRMLGRGTFDVMPYVRALTLYPVGELAPNVIWTLRHEALFYAVFALSYLGPRWLRPLLPLWFAAPVIYALLGLPHAPIAPGVQLVRLIASPANLQFAAGFAVGLLWLRRSRDIAQHVPIIDPFLLLTLLFSGWVFATAMLSPGTNLLGFTVVAIALGTPILLLSLHAICPPGAWQRFGRLLGAASYSIYLFHLHIVSAVMGVWSQRFPDTPVWLAIGSIVLIAIIGGTVIHLAVERPLVRATQRLLSGRPVPSRPAPAPVA